MSRGAADGASPPTSDARDASRLLGRLAGKRVRVAAVGVGSFLTIDIGGRRRNSLGVTVGEFHLWVYGGSWVVRNEDAVLARSDDGRSAMESAVDRISGTSVLRAEIDPGDLSLRVRFTDGLTLRVDRSCEPDLEHWMLYLPDGDVISAGPGSALVREPADGSAPPVPIPASHRQAEPAPESPVPRDAGNDAAR